ncbi:MAG TPA: hypothetical protein VFO77_01205 [Actinoplanes sp.]|nr:hypothetical protein [Actinoplanes sp.]
MSVKSRLAAAGLPVAGLTVFAALALTGQPASAAVEAVTAPQGVAAGLAAPCTPGPRTTCGYGYTTPADDDTATDDDTGTGAGAGPDDDDRGGPGYGGESPAPTATPDVVPSTTPPGGAGPAEVPNGRGDILPVTGAPMGTLTAVGGLLTAAGAALCFGVWLNARRRRA